MIHLSSCNCTRRELWLSKVVEIQVFKIDENSEFFLFPLRLGSLTLKLGTYEYSYLHPVASKASGGRILNTNQLNIIEQLFNTNQQIFLKKKTPFIYCDGQQKKFWITTHLKYMYFKNIGGQYFFFLVNLQEEYISLRGTQRMGNLNSLSGLSHFMAKKR